MAPGGEISQATFSEKKQQRIQQWKNKTEIELQTLISNANNIRKQINEAKTSTKKAYYNKKFQKIQKDVLQYVSTLQRLEVLEKQDESTAT